METTLQVININNHNLASKEVNGQRVVTFKDVDKLHERPDGTAKRNFNENKEYFIEGEDFYKICANEIRTNKIMDISIKTHQDIVFLTEFGYLMLVKSFTDKLAWQVQRQLVNGYFRAKSNIIQPIQPTTPLLEQSIISLQTSQQNILDCLTAQACLLQDLEKQIAELKEHHHRASLEPVETTLQGKALLHSIIRPLAEKWNDGSKGYNATYRKVYVAMDVNWKYRLTRFVNKNGGVTKLSKIELVASDGKLLDLFRETVAKMLQG